MPKPSRTIGEILEQHRGMGPGFDALRVFLSLGVLAWHSIVLAKGKAYYPLIGSSIHPLIVALLPAFFALSGFLVTGSALRTGSIRTFLAFRALRLVPALTVEVALSALILGAVFTTLPLGAYFTSLAVWTYFGNIVSLIQFTLPGVFESNPYPAVVNGSLWTLRPEFYCYAIITILMLTQLIYHRKLFSIFMLLGTVALAGLNVFAGVGAPERVVPWHVLVFYFFVGIAMYHWRQRIPYSPALFAACCLVTYFTITLPASTYFVAWPLGYMVLFIGATKIPPIPLLHRGDYSYGIYLFAFPVQQALVYSLPAMREPMALFIGASVITIAFSALSWHWIEKPSLKLKKFIPQKKAPAPVLPETAREDQGADVEAMTKRAA